MAKEKAEKKAPAAAKLVAKKEPRQKAKALPPLPKPKTAAAPKPAKAEPKDPVAPVLVEQLNEKGEMEQVDFNLYCNVITCAVPGCGQIRYVKNADRHQVTMCKQHAKRERRRRVRASRKARGIKPSKFVEKKKAAKTAKK